MFDQILPASVSKALEVLLQIGLSRLRTSTDGHCQVLVIVARGACLKEVSAGLIDGADEESNTEGSLGGVIGLHL